MKEIDFDEALSAAVDAAKAAGRLMRKNLRSEKKENEATQHDIKLELDVQAQKVIENILNKKFKGVPVLGEEGITGDLAAKARWVVDPIDGTVNFAYGIPHACVSIALQQKEGKGKHRTVAGVVYDPFSNELFSATINRKSELNGTPIHVSRRGELKQALVAIGFSKSPQTLDSLLPGFCKLVYKIRKIRIMGSAALSLVYVAAGRLDAYVERTVRLWDIAAGGLILEQAGGEFWTRPAPGDYAFEMIASNGLLRRKVGPFLQSRG